MSENDQEWKDYNNSNIGKFYYYTGQRFAIQDALLMLYSSKSLVKEIPKACKFEKIPPERERYCSGYRDAMKIVLDFVGRDYGNLKIRDELNKFYATIIHPALENFYEN